MSEPRFLTEEDMRDLGASPVYVVSIIDRILERHYAAMKPFAQAYTDMFQEAELDMDKYGNAQEAFNNYERARHILMGGK